jgi:formylglycine-generating enzyme required for sulfatase activity
MELGSSKEMIQLHEEELKHLIEDRQKELNDLQQTKMLSNAYDMEFVYLPPGTFKMGSPDHETGHMGNETQHEVTLSKGIYIQNTEVTYEQWENVMGKRPRFSKGCNWQCPVQGVSWNDANEFIDKLNKKLSSNQYRLPTEAEWEYAARAGSESAFANGDITEKECGHDQNLDALGWYCGNSNGKLHSVGEKEPNEYGLYDMHGNVWEWCKDWYSYNYPSGPATDPMNHEENSHRIVRGGSWLSPAMKCRAAYRLMYKPTASSIDVGFRLVLDPNK